MAGQNPFSSSRVDRCRIGTRYHTENLETLLRSFIEAVRLDKKEAPQKEIERQTKEADDLEIARQKSKKTFQPE